MHSHNQKTKKPKNQKTKKPKNQKTENFQRYMRMSAKNKNSKKKSLWIILNLKF